MIRPILTVIGVGTLIAAAPSPESLAPVAKKTVAVLYFDNNTGRADYDPLGKGIHLGDGSRPSEIIGVVGHVKQWGLDRDDSHSLREQLYLPFRQMGWNSEADVVARVEGAEGKTATAQFDALRRVVQSQHSDNVIYEPRTMNEVIADSQSRRRFAMILLNAFAAVALLMASVGLYGVMAASVRQRQGEIGVRLALGATAADVRRLVLGEGVRLAAAGAIAGLVLAFAATRVLRGLLFETEPLDPVSLVTAAFVLVGAAAVATWLPARRATRVDPIEVLRAQ